MRHYSAKTIIFSGIFIALIIIFTHVFSIQTPFIRISLGFLPLAVYASVSGPLRSGLAGAAADIIGCLLFFPGLYFPGFTISSFVSGFIYGTFFYNKPVSIKRIIIAFAATFFVVDLFLNTIWLSLLYNKAAMAFLTGRIIKNIITLPINIFLFYIISKSIKPYIQKTLLK